MSTKHQIAARTAAPPDYFEAIGARASMRGNQIFHPATYRQVYDLDQ